MSGADDGEMTSKNSSVGASTTMSSLGKACLELSRSIKGFRFSRQSPQDSKDTVTSSGAQTATVTTTTEDGSVPVSDEVTCAVSDGATAGGSSVTSTISRVIRSATNRVRAFPSSPQSSPHQQQQQQQQLQACNAVNGHSPPAHVPLPLSTPPPPRCRAPTGSADVWHDEQFLLGFFRYFSAMELCVLAQVRQPPSCQVVTQSLTPPSPPPLSPSRLICDFIYSPIKWKYSQISEYYLATGNYFIH